MFGELGRVPFLRRNDKARSLTAIGLAVLAVVVCAGIVATFVVGIDFADQGSFPTPATIVLLLLGFVLSFAPRRRR